LFINHQNKANRQGGVFSFGPKDFVLDAGSFKGEFLRILPYFVNSPFSISNINFYSRVFTDVSYIFKS
jgi:hypothetical protein